MRREDLIAYANRDWESVAAAKERYWAERKACMTPTEVFELVDALREEMKSRRPDWPSAEERRIDLETHARVSECLQRVRSRTR